MIAMYTMLYFTLLLLLVEGIQGESNTTRTTRTAQEGSFDGGLQNLEIAPKVLTNVPYGNARLSVWEHLDNPNREADQKQYFVTPLVMLQPQLSQCSDNIFTGATRLELHVLMWSDDIESGVLQHLRLVTSNPAINSHQITTLPFEEIRLVWKNNAEQLDGNFQLNMNWQSYANQAKSIRFELVVANKDLCEEALAQLRESPDVLSNLELQYVLHGAQSARKTLHVSGSHVRDAKLYSDLSNLADATGDVYLNSHDTNKLANQVVQSVSARVTTDADYVDTGDELSLAKIVEGKLAEWQTDSSAMNEKLWSSTFWDPSYARPDKTASTLNKLIVKDEGENHTVHINDDEHKGSFSGKIGVNVIDLFGGDASASGSSEGKSHVSEDDLRKWLKEQNADVEWTGERFKVKPMKLNRVNLQSLSSEAQLASQSVQVHRVQFTYSISLYLPEDSEIAANGTADIGHINERVDRNDGEIRDLKTRLHQLDEAILNNLTTLDAESRDQDSALKTDVQKQLDELKNSANDLVGKFNSVQSYSRLAGKQTCIQFSYEYPNAHSHTCDGDYFVGSCFELNPSWQRGTNAPGTITDDGRTCRPSGDRDIVSALVGSCCLRIP